MAKNKSPAGAPLVSLVAWITGVLVSLTVGFAMIDGTLGLPSWLGGNTAAGVIVLTVAGWIVVVTTILSVVLALLNK
ncbi:hypothetical protein KAR91_05810 [Candidatus Pacearchaeota archaeon]|nr:hypothetical protein [Candidatus Pacearchaeota archaeon]